MAERVVHFSDISGEMIQDESQLARVTVFEHPDLQDGTVELDVTTQEIEGLTKLAMSKTVEIEVQMPGEDQEPQRFILTATNFAKLSPEKPMTEVLEGAKSIDARRETVRPVVGQLAVANTAPQKETKDYTSIEWAGAPHKGKTAPEEQYLVRRKLLEINERLRGQGLREIDPSNPDHARRYGLTEEHVKLVTEAKAKEAAEAEQAQAGEQNAEDKPQATA